jgi:hypothetical protein
MAQREANRVLIAVELGADWPFWISRQVAAVPRRVLTQGEGESSDSFAVRVLAAARQCHKKGGLASAVVICNERTDTAQQSSRRRLLIALPRSLRGKNKKLSLVASAAGSDRLNAALKALLAQIEATPHTPPLDIADGSVARVA